MSPVRYRAVVVFILFSILLSGCSNDLWGTYSPQGTSIPQDTLDPTITATLPTMLVPDASPTPGITVTSTSSPTLQPTLTVTPGTPPATIVYISQAGDSLVAVARHFGIQTSDITSALGLPTEGLINPNTPLVLPNLLAQEPTTPSTHIIPDAEVVYSATAVGFDFANYIQAAEGKMSTLREPLGGSIISGTEEIQRMAFGSSISPRMLLALIQYFTGWVQGQPMDGVDETYPLGYINPQYPGLYQQLRLIVRELLAGYYGWRDGSLTELTFPDGTKLRIAPDLNAGTVAIQYMFSRRYNYADWLRAIDPDTGFPKLFDSMFGDPWERAQIAGPLFPPNLNQPNFTLPFVPGALWSLTGGPHPAWEQESAWAALDFAPASGDSGCVPSDAWVVAVAPGRIVRSGDGYVVLDLDGDGYEETGWDVLYMHIADQGRIANGIWVDAGAHIGHPSCEGGTATGTHLHIARKYNGEWVPAGDPLPFVLSGWTAHIGDAPYKGTLTKGDQTITASQTSTGNSHIVRQPNE